MLSTEYTRNKRMGREDGVKVSYCILQERRQGASHAYISKESKSAPALDSSKVFLWSIAIVFDSTLSTLDCTTLHHLPFSSNTRISHPLQRNSTKHMIEPEPNAIAIAVQSKEIYLVSKHIWTVVQPCDK